MKKCSNKNCIYNGKLQPLDNFSKNKVSKDGYQNWCKKCVGQYQKLPNTKQIIKKSTKQYESSFKCIQYRKKYRQTLKGKYNSYKRNSKSRNISFNLTLEQFSVFWKQPCYYCKTEIETVGIDRVDNSKGYSMDNCVSCCKDCNINKRETSLLMAQKMVEFKHNKLSLNDLIIEAYKI